ncbi:structure-specific endonuclease subunit slx1 [Mercurialis annua]|uniref:structure-specific endonuclease subunit slx1 n=1 Tax=Mercurialis annua TaxID=3986 RepID=UPI00215EAC3C|nr:structure-specific endonuclease subunit slx1 [Mercurialis annua]
MILSKTFRSIKSPIFNKSKLPSSEDPSSSSSSSTLIIPISRVRSWCVYLILSTNPPIKTYVGVTNHFSRRLNQHNGELKGGAKASRAGRPWVCACIVHGFNDRSEACEFESKWKNLSRKLHRKGKSDGETKQSVDASHALLQHRQKALDRTKDSFDCSHLEIDWKINTS